MQNKMEAPEAILSRLFDVRNHGKKIKPNKEEFKYNSINLQIKQAYLKHFLQGHWEQICGENLARHCFLERIDGKVLYVGTSSSLFANELYMMKALFLQKVNAFLLGQLVIKDVFFHAGKRSTPPAPVAAEVSAEPAKEFVTCPACGKSMLKGSKTCSICEREHKEKLRRDLAELLNLQPWLKYEEATLYYPCERIFFNTVKSNLKGYYCEKVRTKRADARENLLAVLLHLEKHPEALTQVEFENTLNYLRRDQYVSTFRR